jgi:hypothetical protein
MRDDGIRTMLYAGIAFVVEVPPSSFKQMHQATSGLSTAPKSMTSHIWICASIIFDKERFMTNDLNKDKSKQPSGIQDPTGSVNTTDRTKNDPSRSGERSSNSEENFNRTPTSGSDSRERKDPGGSEQVEEKRRAS